MQKLKAYFTSSNLENKNLQPNDKKIIAFLKKKTQLLTNGLLTNKNLKSEEVFNLKKRLIEQADFVVAEVTNPSTAVGGEIVYALVKDKPVLSLFYKDAEDKLSPMLKGNPSENLYLEHYDEDNLQKKIEKFVIHVLTLKKRKGKLIVIDGGDGSGKTVQSQLLVNYLKKQNIPVKYYDFPRYYSSFHGRLVGRFLAGEFGQLDQISPYLSSLAYALDRASVKEEMDEWLAKGGVIVCNRYVTSNMAHQAARLSEEKRQEFLNWIDELEYRQHKMPRPDLVIYLYVPWQIGLKLTEKKAKKRGYVKEADIAEKDIHHRQEAEKMYLYLAKNKKNWVKIDCVIERKILPIEEIHKKIVEVINTKLKI
jgi:dTMP kinase